MSNVESKAHAPPYIIHKYFARRPHNVFYELIKKYSKPEDIILDPFSGGGVTVYEGLRLGRKVIGNDINPLAKFITENMIQKQLPKEFEETVSHLKALLNSLYFKYCSFECPCGKTAIPEMTEAAFTAKCPACASEMIFSNERKHKTGVYRCEHCSGTFPAHKCKRTGYKYLSAQYRCLCSKKLKLKIFNKTETDLIDKQIRSIKRICENKNIKIIKDLIPDAWDRQAEDGLKRKGIVSFGDLFTERNLLVNSILLHEIKTIPISIKCRKNLRLIFSSSLKDTSIMSLTTKDWQQGKPITWSKHAFWIPSQFCEVNILWSFDRAASRFKSSCEYNSKHLPNLLYANNYASLKSAKGAAVVLSSKDSANLKLPANSVDAIITDPPYGSNVQYNELSAYWNIWNKDIYNFKLIQPNEAVVNRKKSIPNSKDYDHYQKALTKIMQNSYKALKPGGKMIMTFNNNDLKTWVSILASISRSGFEIEVDKLSFQPGVRNYHQTAHTISAGTIHGDFILVFKKKRNGTHPKKHSRFSNVDNLLIELNEKQRITKKANYKSHGIAYFKTILPQLWTALRQPMLESNSSCNVSTKNMKNKHS